MAAINKYEIEIPKDVQVSLQGNQITVKGKNGELTRSMDMRFTKIENKENKIILTADSKRSVEKALTGTAAAHLKNIVQGVQKPHEYKLKIVYAHFPINVSVQKDRVEIKNFVGEKVPRQANVIGKTRVEIKGQEIVVTGSNVEEAGQTAANIEKATRIRGKDLRVFQDGIYITHKPE